MRNEMLDKLSIAFLIRLSIFTIAGMSKSHDLVICMAFALTL